MQPNNIQCSVETTQFFFAMSDTFENPHKPGRHWLAQQVLQARQPQKYYRGGRASTEQETGHFDNSRLSHVPKTKQTSF